MTPLEFMKASSILIFVFYSKFIKKEKLEKPFYQISKPLIGYEGGILTTYWVLPLPVVTGKVHLTLPTTLWKRWYSPLAEEKNLGSNKFNNVWCYLERNGRV